MGNGPPAGTEGGDASPLPVLHVSPYCVASSAATSLFALLGVGYRATHVPFGERVVEPRSVYGAAPVLVDRGRVIEDVRAVRDYVHERMRPGSVFPGDVARAAEVRDTLCELESGLLDVFYRYLLLRPGAGPRRVAATYRDEGVGRRVFRSLVPAPAYRYLRRHGRVDEGRAEEASDRLAAMKGAGRLDHPVVRALVTEVLREARRDPRLSEALDRRTELGIFF